MRKRGAKVGSTNERSRWKAGQSTNKRQEAEVQSRAKLTLFAENKTPCLQMLELARLVQHNAAVRLPLLEVEDMLLAWMDLPQE
jgi:hypothetical protein